MQQNNPTYRREVSPYGISLVSAEGNNWAPEDRQHKRESACPNNLKDRYEQCVKRESYNYILRQTNIG